MIKSHASQETSCHSVEATALDDLFNRTFEEGALVNRQAFLHTVTPLASLPVAMYSDTRNVLTGVIESPETLSEIARMYVKTLVWYLIGHLVKQKKRTKLNHEKVVNDGADDTGTPQESSGDQVIKLQHEEARSPAVVLPRSASVEAVQLDKWPSSTDNSPEDKSRGGWILKIWNPERI